jgi:arsenate reductase-like glutaredoxin family protein
MTNKLILGGTCSREHLLTEETIYRYPDSSKQAGTIRCSICKQMAKDKYRGVERVDHIVKVATKDRTHCPSKHLYDDKNTYLTKDNKRQCKTCSREREYLRNYGITIKDYDQMFTDQQGLCAICKLSSDKRLCVDHNHTSGAVRELLCDNCNVGIARFLESVSALQSAIEYIQKHNY